MTLIKFNAETVVLQGNDIALKLNFSSDKTLVDPLSAPYEYRYVWSPIRMGDSATDYAKFEDGELIASSWIRVPTKPSLDEDTSKGELWVNVPHFAWDVALKYEVRAIDESGLRGEATSTSYFAALYNDFGKITINSVNWHGGQADMMDTLTTTYTIDRLPVMNPIDYDPAVSNVAIASAYKTAVAAALNDPILEVKYWLSSEDGVGTPVSFAPNSATTTIIDWNPSKQITQDFTLAQQISTKRSYFFNLALQMPDPSGDGYVVWEKTTWSPYLILKQNNASLKIKKLGITVNMDRSALIHSGAGIFNTINGIRSAGNKAHSIALYNTETINGVVDKPSIGFMNSQHREIATIEATKVGGEDVVRVLSDKFILQDKEGNEGIFSAKSISLGLHNGVSSYVHLAYANSADGSSLFSKTESVGRRYLGTMTSTNPVGSNNASDYTWTLFVGEDGYTPVKGVDYFDGQPGSSSTIHIAYANSINGTGFSLSSSGKEYMGVRVVTAGTAQSQTPSDYTWSLIRGLDGSQGIPGTDGTDGVDGVSTYVHVAYANSSDGYTDFSTTDFRNRSYLGTYTDNVSADSQDHTKYTWSLTLGRSVTRVETQYIKTINDNNGNPVTPTSSAEWLNSMPLSWSADESIWTRTVSFYSDNTFEDGSPVLMSDLSAVQGKIDTLTSQIEQEATARENIEIGATNLLLQSKELALSSNLYSFEPNLYTSEDLVPGQVYTVTIWGENDYDVEGEYNRFGVYLVAGTYRLCWAYREKDGAYRGNFKFTQELYNWAQTNGHDHQLRFYNFPQRTNTSSTIKAVKLEKGNKSTDWSPAPNDIISDLNDIKAWFKTEDGVSTWGRDDSPFKIRIDSQKVAIIENGTEISYFGQDTLDADTLRAKTWFLENWTISESATTGFTIS